MKYIVDIDNTICYNQNSDYEQSKPDMDRIAKLNKGMIVLIGLTNYLMKATRYITGQQGVVIQV